MATKETKSSERRHIVNFPDAADIGVIKILIRKLNFPDRAERRRSAKLIKKIMKSYKTYGFLNPVIIDEFNNIVCGVARVLAAKEIGLEEVPAIQVVHLSKEQLKAYRLADNRLAEEASWDEAELALVINEIILSGLDPDLTGFDAPEIDYYIDIIDNPVPDEQADQVPNQKDTIKRVAEGDLWQLGKHKLYCGSALEPFSYKCLLGNECATSVNSDPPYNVPIKNHVCGKGKIQHDEFKMASGEMSSPQFTKFLFQYLKLATKYCVNGALIYNFMDWRHLYELHSAALQLALEQINLCVWKKTNAGMGSFYRSQHEMIGIYKYGKKAHQNNIELGKHGRNRTNVWEYPSVNSMDPSRKGDLALHPTVKPVAMIADAIRDSSKRGQIILDPFAGSGTTIIAAEMTGRIARCIELDPHYCDVILSRFEALTGQTPIKVSEATNNLDKAADAQPNNADKGTENE